MSYKSILAKIDELRVLVGGWESEPAALEMDMALERVKSIYEMLRFPIEEPQIEEVDEPQAEALQVEEPQQSEVDDEEDIHLELVNVTQIVEDEPQQAENTIALEQHEREIAEITSKKRERLSRILSLYEEQIEEQTEEAEPETVIENVSEDIALETETEQEVAQVATEQLEQEVGLQEADIHEDNIIEEPQVQVVEVRSVELGLNDRLLLSQDLFDGDVDALMIALGVLYNQPTIDDAMIHIAENYMWNGDCEGAQLLMSLLENHYQN